MKLGLKKLLFCISIPLLIGALSGYLTKNSADLFSTLNKPPLSPPGWIFPIVWSLLYLMMGIASYLVLTSGQPNQQALLWYAVQLALNFLWPILFFNLELYFLSFILLVLLWWSILKTIELFYEISKPAAYLLIPYLLWVTFAGYLNFTIALLN